MKHTKPLAALAIMVLGLGRAGDHAVAQDKPPLKPDVRVGPDPFASYAAKSPVYSPQGSRVTTSGKDELQASSPLPVPVPLKTSVEGRVLDGQGRPIAGALVAALGYDTLTRAGESITHIVTTDAQGHFKLEGLRVGENRIGAARGRDFGLGTTVVAETPSTATTPDVPTFVIYLTRGEAPVPPENWAAGFAFIKSHPPSPDANNAVGWGLLYKLLPHDPARTLAVMDERKVGSSDDIMARAFGELAAQNPELAVRWGRDRISKGVYLNEKHSRYLAFTLRTTDVDPQNARNTYFYLTNTDLTDLSPEHASDFAFLAALAARLKDPDAQSWLQVLSASLERMSTNEAFLHLLQYGRILAEGSPTLAQSFIAGLSPTMQIRALAGAIPIVAQSDPPTALKLMGDMEALTARPGLDLYATPTVEHLTDTHYLPMLPSIISLLIGTRCSLARALLKTDPQAAFDLARKIDDMNFGVEKVPLMAEAAVRLPRTAAIPALRATCDIAQANTIDPAGLMAQVAALTMSIDAKLGEEFFAKARANLGGTQPDPNNPDSMGIGTEHYALYRAPFAPEESRLLIENEWQRVTTLIRSGRLEHMDRIGVRVRQMIYLCHLATAVCAVNMARAQEMLAETNTFDNEKGYRIEPYVSGAQDRILGWIIASEQERLTLFYY